MVNALPIAAGNISESPTLCGGSLRGRYLRGIPSSNHCHNLSAVPSLRREVKSRGQRRQVSLIEDLLQVWETLG